MKYGVQIGSSTLALAIAAGLFAPVNDANAQTANDSPTAQTSESDNGIVVTARRREETLQDVPDSIQAFSAKTLEAAGIRDVSSLVSLTPNITLRESFRQGQSYITVRGITTGQQGWSPVTYVVDGVPAGSSDSINTGALVGIERIEVLKGPQSALYGAGAIAGAINIITKEPGSELSGQIVAGIANGKDRKLIGSISAPLNDNIGVRFDSYYHRGDGLQKDQLGRGLNFDRTVDLRGRVIFDYDPVKIDLRGHIVDTHAGAVFQELLPPTPAGLALIDDFKNSPGQQRGIVGDENRKLKEGSAKIDIDLGFATLSSITAYSDLRQNLFGSTSWNSTPTAASFCGPVGGPGEPPDCTQASTDNFRTFSQDLRIQSNGGGTVDWLFGASMLNRRAVNGLTVGAGALDSGGNIVTGPTPFLQRADVNRDHFKGIYGQLLIKITDDLELTGALRYDENSYNSTQYGSEALAAIVPVLDSTGALVNTQRAKDSAWQPKVQLSYSWTPNVMTYVTVAKGFRTGFFNTGNRTLPETTWNYEGGIKSTLMNGLMTANLSVFHIDYSNQQFTSIIPTPPFRATSNIPETKINGFELDTAIRLTDGVNAGVSLGLTDSKVQSTPVTHSPYTPKFTTNIYLDFDQPLSDDVGISGRVDYRHQSSQYLGVNDQFRIGSKNYVDVRLSLSYGDAKLTGFVRNLTNERQAFGFEFIGFGYLRYNNNPRSYGAELSYKF